MMPVTRPAWDKFDPATRSWVADDEKAREQFAEATVTAGVVRWNANGRVPPADCLAQWAKLGLRFDLAKSEAVREAELTAFFAAYRQQPRLDDAESAFERRAAFGPGAKVVDILSGQKYRT